MGAVDSAGTLARGMTGLLVAAGLATGAAAGVAGWRYWHDPSAALGAVRPLAVTRTTLGPDLFRMADGDDRGVQVPSPGEVEHPAPLVAAPPARERPPVLPRPAPSHAVRDHRDCDPRCSATASAVPARAALVPPRRPDSLRAASPARGVLAESDVAVADAVPTPERARIFGVPLMPFAPVGQAVMRRVADLGETLGAPVADLIDAVR